MKSRRKFVIIFVSLWVVSLGVVFTLLTLHQFDDGDIGEGVEDVSSVLSALLEWNVADQLSEELQTAISTGTGEPVAVVFLHPQCPCSRATVNMIERSLSLPEYASSNVVFISFTSDAFAENWNMSGLVRKAGMLPGSTLIMDDQSQLAHIFGAKISGEVLAFNSDGALAYHGGVTTSRGHEGPNPGIEAMEAVLRGDAPERTSLPVYGCFLMDETLKILEPVDETGLPPEPQVHQH